MCARMRSGSTTCPPLALISVEPENVARAMVLDISKARPSSYSSRFFTMLDAKLVSKVADATTARLTTRTSMAAREAVRGRAGVLALVRVETH